MTRVAEERVLSTAVEAHQATRWRIPSDFLSKAHYLRILSQLEMKSSPGYPYNVRHPTNKDLFGADEHGNMNQSRVEEVWSAVLNRLAEMREGREASDHVRLFIKPEPMKERKLLQHKYRLIASVSVVDQIIDHMLFDDMNEKLYASWDQVPSKVGWSPYVGGWKIMPRETWMALDKSSWDWTVNLWIIDLVFKLRQLLCDNISDEWLKLALMRYKILHEAPTFVTSAGVVLRQRMPGVLKSGCVNTIADNSMMQYLLHLRVCQEIGIASGGFMAIGDDTLQQPMPEREKYLEVMGQYCIVKKFEMSNEFAGMLFKGMQVEPQYVGKHAYTILHMDNALAEDIATAYSLLYHRSKYRNWFERLFADMGLQIPSRIRRDAIFDGLE